MNTNIIQTECTKLHRSLQSEEAATIELYMQEVRNCAFNLAKATKALITQFQ